jgi:hypothetical protein
MISRLDEIDTMRHLSSSHLIFFVTLTFPSLQCDSKNSDKIFYLIEFVCFKRKQAEGVT